MLGIVLEAASSFSAAVIAGTLRIRSRGEVEAGEGVARQFASGVEALSATPTAAILLLFAALDTLVAGAYPVLYIPISQHLGTDSDSYGYLLAASAIGGIAGAALADRLGAPKRLAPTIVGGLVVQAVPCALTPL